MPRIEFIEDAEYDVANEDGTRRTVRISKGSVQDVNEASAARWERRSKVRRILSQIEQATNLAIPLAPGVEAVVPPAPGVEAVVPLAPPAPLVDPVAPFAPPPPPPPPAVEVPKRQVGRPRIDRTEKP
jgi:hypothetical protein